VTSERVGVLLINFGEPPRPAPEQVEPFLERIFLQNAGLEPSPSARERARQLARERTPGLIDEYRAIGGSPLNAQADAQAEALDAAMRARCWDVRTYSAFQFTAPSVSDKVRQAREDGIDVLVALPVYPLCGHSTTAAALESVRTAMAELEWRPRFVGVAGWHHHPAYVAFRAEHLRTWMAEQGLDASASDTVLYFSAHGTPLKYLEEGNRYDRYVEEHTRDLTRRVAAAHRAVGFQNHTNRRIAWTQPDNEERLRSTEQTHVIVVPVSFMHEQSETLVELDQAFRARAESLGKQVHRVPVPHDARAFVHFLADLVATAVAGGSAGPASLSRCRCVPGPDIWCTNGDRDLPPTPYARPGRPLD
jgi:ferrochelatase